jgi:hypothetical protein
MNGRDFDSLVDIAPVGFNPLTLTREIQIYSSTEGAGGPFKSVQGCLAATRVRRVKKIFGPAFPLFVQKSVLLGHSSPPFLSAGRPDEAWGVRPSPPTLSSHNTCFWWLFRGLLLAAGPVSDCRISEKTRRDCESL